MVSQKRARCTRQRLLEAAATEFAHHGYAGTSLMRVSRAAGVTMGALAFHFPSKLDLAISVCADGADATRWALARVDEPDKPALQSVIDITHALEALLRQDPAVRAAGRLSQESGLIPANWTDSWMPRVRQLLRHASQGHVLRPHAAPDLVALLVRYLVAGLEMSARGNCACPRDTASLGAIWDVVLPGITYVPQVLRPSGTAHLSSSRLALFAPRGPYRGGRCRR